MLNSRCSTTFDLDPNELCVLKCHYLFIDFQEIKIRAKAKKDTPNIMNVYIAYLFGFFGFLAAVFKLYESLSNRSPKIVFFFDEVIDLYKSTINIEGLEVIYNASPINKNLYLLNYIFVYSGKKDIVTSDFNKGIELSLNGEGKILSHNVILNPSNINLSFERIANKFSFKADLIKDEDFFVGEVLVEYNERIENPVTLFNVSSRIINIDKPKLYNYRYVKIENDTPIFDWVVILTGPVLLVWMWFAAFYITGSREANKRFSKDGIYFNADSLITKVNDRSAVYSFLKGNNIKDSVIEALHNEDLKFVKAFEASNKINLYTEGDFAKLPTEDSFLGFFKSDTFVLGDGYTIYYKRESVTTGVMMLSIIVVGFSYVFIIGYRANKNRLLDIRLRRLYIKSKKIIAKAK